MAVGRGRIMGRYSNWKGVYATRRPLTIIIFINIDVLDLVLIASHIFQSVAG